MEKTSIKSCPFCGNDGDPDNLVVGDCWHSECGSEPEKYFHVRCDSCQAAGPYASDEESAILFWNERLSDGHYFTMANLVLPEILHNLRAGTVNGIKLSAKDCDNLLKVMGVSVTLETIIENIMTLCQTTLTNDPMTRKVNAVRPKMPVSRRYDDNFRAGKSSVRNRSTEVCSVSPPIDKDAFDAITQGYRDNWVIKSTDDGKTVIKCEECGHRSNLDDWNSKGFCPVCGHGKSHEKPITQIGPPKLS